MIRNNNYKTDIIYSKYALSIKKNYINLVLGQKFQNLSFSKR